jgi:hypothetical protein
MCEPEPVFHEQWYLETELAMLEAATRLVKPLHGAVIEIGCWEGRSGAVIANACYPETLIAVDTWVGSLSEHPEHDTVRIARVRDVFAVFRANMQRLTCGNFGCDRSEAITAAEAPGPQTLGGRPQCRLILPKSSKHCKRCDAVGFSLKKRKKTFQPS